MKRSEAEKLLGGHATGTLTAAERSTLFAAALGHQAIFDALMDEEILRELLADPAAKAQLLAALVLAAQATPAPPKIVPFWRRTGVLGAAASLMVAATAGLAYLRSPNAMPSAMPSVARTETAKESAAKVAEATAPAQAPAAAQAQAGAQAPALALRKSAPAQPARGAAQSQPEALAPAPPAATPAAPKVAGAVTQVAEDSARLQEKAEFRWAEARDQLDKKVEPRPAAAAAMEMDVAKRSDARERKAATQDKAAAPAEVATGAVGSVVGGGVGNALHGGVASPSSSPAPATAKAKAAGGLATNAAPSPAPPTWTLETRPEGRTRVTVSAPRGQTVTLLRRSPAGVEVLPLQPSDEHGRAQVQWRVELRLAPGDLLDLYLLNAPVADPSQLPETGPVDGLRVRIHPASK
jgi:hypothetical protein